MMLTQRIISTQKLPRYLCVITHMKDHFYSTKNEVNPSVVEIPELRLSEHKEKMKKREPFVKNFFRGKFDVEFAAFPEPQTYDRHGEFFQWLKPIEDYIESCVDGTEIDKTGKISPEILEELRNLGVFRAAVPDEYNGLGLNYSEYAKLVETLSRIPALGIYFGKRTVPVNFISRYASDTQKSMYLSRIADAECIPTVCISEDNTGSEGSAILTTAKQSDCGNFWSLNGVKTYVVNGDKSDLFIVFAECPDAGDESTPEDTISAFIVERSFGGITIGPPADTLGFRGLSLCEITFKNTMVPVQNLVGDIGFGAKFFTSIFSDGKQYIGAQAIGITKQYLKLLVNHMKTDRDFNAVKFKNDTVQEIIGKVCCSIYGMESALYLTTGLMDTVMNQDCEIEQCIVESYCIDACIQSVIMGTHILGLSSQLKNSAIEQLIRDAICLISIDGTKANIQSIISLMGVQYIGKEIGSNIKKLRNPWAEPLMTIKKLLFNKNIRLPIADNLHPSLKETAELLEGSIVTLKDSIEEILLRHGCLIVERQMDLRRISDTVSHLYILAAILSRSSRSYCLGMRNSDSEIRIAQVFGYILYQKIKMLIVELNDGNYVNGDALLKNIADSTFETNGYFVASPLARNY